MKTILSKTPHSIQLYLCLLISCWSSFPLYSQIDQLKQRLSLPDTENRIDLYVDLVLQCYYLESPDSVAKYAERSMVLAKQLDLPIALAKAHYCKGVAAFAAGQPKESLTETHLALEKANLVQDTGLLLNIRNLRGNNYYDIGLLEMAMEEYLQAIHYAQQMQLTAKAAAAYANMARILFNKQSYDEAKRYYTLAAEMGLQAKDTLRAIGILMNKVSTHLRLNEMDSAQVLADWGLQKSTELDFKNGVSMANIRQAHLAIRSRRYERALQVVQDMLDTVTPSDYDTRYNAWYFRSIALDSLGQYSLAIEAAEEALRYAALTNRKTLLVAANRQLYLANKHAGLAEPALAYYEAYRTLEDTILDSNTARKLTTMKHLYETEQQNYEIKQLEDTVRFEKLRSRQWLLLLGSALLIVSLVGGWLFYVKQQKTIKERQERQLIEQKLLSLQMNPHFLFNTLTSLQRYLLEKENVETAHLYLSKLSQLMRNILTHSREKLIPLEDELQNLKAYLQLQKLRFKHKLNYQLEVDEQITIGDYQVPPMLIQPLVENAIEHAGITSKEDGQLCIHMQKKPNGLRILISDNGTGWAIHPNPSSANAHQGVALQIVKDRLALLSKLSHDQHEMKIDTRVGQGTTISLHLPFYEDTDY